MSRSIDPAHLAAMEYAKGVAGEAGEPLETVITDLITDLLHLASVATEADPETLAERAITCFLEEAL